MSSHRVSELLKRRQEISNKLHYPPAKQPYISETDKTSPADPSLHSNEIPQSGATISPLCNPSNTDPENGSMPTSSQLDTLVLSVDVSNLESANEPKPLTTAPLCNPSSSDHENGSMPSSSELDALVLSVDVSNLESTNEPKPLATAPLCKPSNSDHENGSTPTSSDLDALVLNVDVSNLESADEPQPFASTPTSVELDELLSSVDVSSFVNFEEANQLTPTIKQNSKETTLLSNQLTVTGASPGCNQLNPLSPRPALFTPTSKQVSTPAATGLCFCTGSGNNLNVPESVKKYRALIFDDHTDQKPDNTDSVPSVAFPSNNLRPR